jgi:hypothetical protein
MKKEPWRKYKTNTYITVYNFLKLDGHTETPLVMQLLVCLLSMGFCVDDSNSGDSNNNNKVS